MEVEGTMPVNVLLVEADSQKVGSLVDSLTRSGYYVLVTNGSQSALEQLKDDPPDLVIFDHASYPDNGSLTCEMLQQEAGGVSMLVIGEPPPPKETRRWVDGHLPDPFTNRQLLAKVKELVAQSQQGRFLRQGEITLDLLRRRVFSGNGMRNLTPRECKLLHMFMSNPGKVLSRKALMKEVWDTDYTGDTRTLDVHVRWIREKIEKNPSAPIYLRTVRGVGYRFGVSEEVNGAKEQWAE